MSDLTSAQSLALESLVDLADEVFPVWLGAKSPEGFLNSGPWRFVGDARRLQILTALAGDSLLSRLHPMPAKGYLAASGYYVSPTGAEGTIDQNLFIDELLRAAWDEAWLTDGSPTPEGFIRATVEQFEMLIDGLAGGQTVVKVRSGVAGIALPASLGEVRLPHGVLRRVDGRKGWIEQQGDGLSGAYGEHVEVIYETTLRSPLEILNSEADIRSGRPTPLWDEHRSQWQYARFALALVKQIPVRKEWDSIQYPVGGQGDWPRKSELSPKVLTEEESYSWQALAFAIDQLPIRNIEVAVDRSLRLLDGPELPDDFLINSVMAWENLFGAVGDTAFRVAASLAWVLERDVEKRLEQFREIKKTYDLRSRVVHGSSHLAPKDFIRAFDARELTFVVLRKVIEEYPSLIAMKDSTARSNNLVVRGDYCRADTK